MESDDLNELPPPGADGSSDKVIRTKNYTRRGMEDIQALIGIGLTLDWYLGEHVTVDFPLLSKSTWEVASAMLGTLLLQGFQWTLFIETPTMH